MFGFSSLRCCDCTWLDKYDKDKYGDFYCPQKRKYVGADDYTCSDFEPNFYVMTAYCKINKLPYNCDEMISLIALRDKYMMEDIKGRPFLEEYESIGPILAIRLETDMYRSDVVKTMKEEYIFPAMEMMLMGDFDGAQESYMEMVEMLKVRYGYAPKKDADKRKKKSNEKRRITENYW